MNDLMPENFHFWGTFKFSQCSEMYYAARQAIKFKKKMDSWFVHDVSSTFAHAFSFPRCQLVRIIIKKINSNWEPSQDLTEIFTSSVRKSVNIEN